MTQQSKKPAAPALRRQKLYPPCADEQTWTRSAILRARADRPVPHVVVRHAA